MNDRLIRALAEYHHDLSLAAYRAENTESWVGSNEPHVADARRRIFEEVSSRLKVHSSKLGHPNADPFASALADRGALNAAWGAGVGPDFESWRPGWEIRYRNAIDAVLSLAKAMEAMDRDERNTFLPSLCVDHKTAKSNAEAMHYSPESWSAATREVAEHFDSFFGRAKSRAKVWESIAAEVWGTAELWVDHFNELPSAADESPFTSVFQAYICALFPATDGKAPSHPNIRAALSQHLPALQQRIRKKSGE